jgi:hypothetical protein
MDTTNGFLALRYDSHKRFFLASYAKINPRFTAERQSGEVGTCQSTCKHWKTTIAASIVYGVLVGF